jgi:hypothetical protein
MAPVYCLTRRDAEKFSTPAPSLWHAECLTLARCAPLTMHHFGSCVPMHGTGTDEKKAHHAVRSNLPRFRLLGSASNIL